MNFELIYAPKDCIDVIRNLMQFYIYDFSEYMDYDVEENGLYKAYPNLEEYWKEEGCKFPYIIKKGKKYVGFILVNKLKTDKDCFSIAEFFIMKKYRREGIGKAAARQLFTLYKGDWQVHQRENNIPAQKFWRKVINEYADGQFSERLENGRRIQNFKS
jgi:predicted acetyltransferase